LRKIENILAAVITLIFVTLGSYLAQSGATAPDLADGDLEIHFLNVGQGDAILLEQQNEQVLIDGGPSDRVISELGAVMPATDKKIEKIILTHPHADHLRGLNYVMQYFEVEKVYFNGFANDTPEFKQFLEIIRERSIPVERLSAGSEVRSLDLTLSVLWPVAELEMTSDVNDTSLIMNGAFKSSRFLFPGDASIASQSAARENLEHVDILKVSHHGSRTGTNDELLAILNPRYAVVTVGKNSYGHPAATVLGLLRRSTILRTDTEGTVSFRVNETGVLLY
jgi:beta-lactamase superfamily II metal-dependent hydrolase